MHQQTCGIDLCRHICKLELDGLKLCDRLSELLPLFRVVERRFICTLRHSNAECRDADAAAVENFQRVDETMAEFAKQVFFRQATVLKNHRGRVARSQAQLVFFFSCGEARRSFFKNECRDSMMSCG